MCNQRIFFLSFFFYFCFLNITNGMTTRIKNNVEVVHPQILIITDTEFRSLFANEKALSEYIASFWKSVNDIFGQLDNPRINLHISDIIIMENSSDYDVHSRAGRKYLFQNLNTSKIEFDVAVMMLGNQMDRTLSGTEGFSINLACDYPNNLIIFADDGKYSKIYVAAHELAHTFSAKHSESSKECSNINKENDIMFPYYLYFQGESKQFSECTKEKMQDFLNSKQALCLHNIPSSEKSTK